MKAASRTIAALAAAGLIALAPAGCGPAEVGTIEAPEVDRTLGPTADPNQPGGGSVIPGPEEAGAEAPPAG